MKSEGCCMRGKTRCAPLHARRLLRAWKNKATYHADSHRVFKEQKQQQPQQQPQQQQQQQQQPPQQQQQPQQSSSSDAIVPKLQSYERILLEIINPDISQLQSEVRLVTAECHASTRSLTTPATPRHRPWLGGCCFCLLRPFVQNPPIYQRLDALFKHWKDVAPAQRMADEKCQAFNKIIKFSKHPSLNSLKEEVSQPSSV
jgi:hypothetical protein